jgi:hypothetical protein
MFRPVGDSIGLKGVGQITIDRTVLHTVLRTGQVRPASGSREFRSIFNAKTVGDSPKEVSSPSEVRREHVRMWKGDKYCPDCKGKELEISMSYTPVTTEYGELRTVSFVVDDVEDTSCSTDITPVATYARSGE